MLLTLLFAYLHRVSGQLDLCVGVPFHNRLTTAARSNLGVFIKLYPVQMELQDDESFRSLLKKTQVATNEYLRLATSNQSVSGSNANFNVVLNFIHARFGEFDSVPVKPVWLHPGCSDRQHHFRLHVENFEVGNQPQLKIDFNLDVFDDQQQQVAVGHFRSLITAMTNDWDTSIGSVDLLSDQEKRQQSDILAPVSPRQNRLVIERLEESIERYGDQLAICSHGKTMTYRELGQQIDRVACAISHHKLEPGSRIAVCLERSTAAVVGMLAILKSGHAFVPIDPSWPPTRIDLLLQDCRAKCVLSLSSQQLILPPGMIRIDLDGIEKTTAAEASSQTEPHQTAYVLYTSGSTGQPKGVEISHASLAHYANWAAEFYGNNQPLSFPLFTPLTFDLTLTSIFVPLLTGGQIVVYPPESRGSDIALLDVIKDDQVDIIKLTPSHLSLLEGRKLSTSRVRQLILGGENLRLDLARQILNNFPAGLVIHNEYGPTEATVGCIVFSLDSKVQLTGGSVPIGKPIPGMQAFVWNECFQPQPIGVPGELFLAGNGLAKGYFGQPDLTAERFSEHPSRPGTRIYRTGDVARFRKDGNLEFLGRQDHQVKIRGARIELGAIEAALSEHAAISQAVVTTYATNAAQQQLEYCVRCGLASNYPEVKFDDQLVCNQCRDFESYREQASVYFQPLTKLEEVFASRPRASEGDYDCIALLSGGKDSTYMLARLADMDLKILAFTLDNGYISDEAKANIRRVVETLGVDHQFGSTEAMNQIFVDSLKRFSNVCQGCFKTIYTLSMNLAYEKKIPFIVTGLSRGQFFETRLTEDLFREPCTSLVQIDQTVLEARKAYHRVDDAVSQLLDVSRLQQEEIFEQIQFVDFYRYCDVELDEMLEYLDRRLPWIRPRDTGRSTNCLINDVGIYVHQRNEGFHNYSLPYSWDVRMGHKQRDAALEELHDRIDVDQVHRILQEIGYDGELANPVEGQRLVAYYVSEFEIGVDELNEHLEKQLPAFMLPSRFIRLDAVPVSPNGKVDLAALPDPLRSQPKSATIYVAPATETESRLTEIWRDVLRVPRVGTRDNFFDLGGDSILAIQIVARANRAGIRMTPSIFFESLTVQKLAQASSGRTTLDVLDDDVTPHLTPIQHWAWEHGPQSTDFWNQSTQIHLPVDFRDENVGLVRKSLAFLGNFHAAFRTKISVADGSITRLPELDGNDLPLRQFDFPAATTDADPGLSQVVEELNQLIRLGEDVLLGGAIIRRGVEDARLLMVANHMAVDAISWHQLIADFAVCYRAFAAGRTPKLEAAPSIGLWSAELQRAANEDEFSGQLDYWSSVMQSLPPLPIDSTCEDYFVSDMRQRITHVPPAVTERLPANLRQGRVSLEELLLAALAKSISTWSGRTDMRIFVERHGRESIARNLDFSRTIGWFTSLSPTRIRLSADDRPREILMAVKDQLRTVPQNGIGYGILRYLHRDKAVRQALATRSPEVVFNYFGKSVSPAESAFSPSDRLRLHRSPQLKTFAALEINVFWDSQLRISFEFNEQLFRASVIEKLAEDFSRQIVEMANCCTAENSGLATATDFPLAKLDAAQLKNLASDRGPNRFTGQCRVMKLENVSDVYPLSPMQEGMLFHAVTEPESGVYVDQAVVSLHGDIDPQRFSDCIQKVFSKFDTLRTAFVWDGVEQPLQIVRTHVDFCVEMRDWMGQSAAQQRTQMLDLVAQQASLGFQLEQAPLIRAILCRCAYSSGSW